MQEEIEDRGDELIEHFSFTADKGQDFIRLDKFLVDRMPKASRSHIQAAAKEGNILVNGKEVKASYKVRPLDVIQVVYTHEKEDYTVEPEPMDLDIVYEDKDVMVINKPAGLVVHPGNANKTGTLVHGLMHHIKNLPEHNGSDRPGIVHRLDKLTTGLMVIGKTEESLSALAMQFFHRTTERRYMALVWGDVEDDGRIEGNIGRSPKNRKLMMVFPEGDYGKPAVTNYKVLKRFGYVTLVECKLETGRTHQIRVHMKYIGHPLFGDPEYGGDKILKGTTFTKYKQFVTNCFKLLPRQALHAKTLGFEHPTTEEFMSFDSDLPEDLAAVIEKWDKYSNHMSL